MSSSNITEHKHMGANVDVQSSKSKSSTTGNDMAIAGDDGSDATTAALLTAIGLASRLASLDARQYREETTSTTWTNSTCSTACWSSVATPSDSDSASASTATTTSTPTRTVQSQLDELQSHWMLEDTPLPHLVESIHRLQSNAILLQNEAAAATEEVVALQTALAESHAQQRTLGRIVRRLVDENERLRQKLAARRRKSRAFVRNVREVLKGTTTTTAQKDGKNNAEYYIAANPTPALTLKLQSHEDLLKRASSALSGSNRRQRAHTADFSDLDESEQSSPFRSYDFDFRSAQSSGELADLRADGHSDDHYNDDEDSFVSSCSSVPCLVTERSMPTISVKATASFPPSPAQIDARTLLGDKEDEIETPSNVYRLTIPTGRQIGIELQRIPLKRRKDDSNEIATALPNNRFDESSEHSYTLADAAAEVSSDIKAIGTLLGNVGKNALLSVTSEEARATRGGEMQQQNSSPESAFLVCGYCDTFDTILNKRPPIGSRLIAIDNVSLETGEWSSFTKVKKCIHHKSRNTTARTFTLTFRLDPLDVEQRSILAKAVAFAKRQQEKTLLGISHENYEEEEDFLLVPSRPAEEEKGG